MALQTYSGITPPLYLDNEFMQATTSVFPATTCTVAGKSTGSNPLWQLVTNDRLLVTVVTNSSTATVSSMTATGLTFTFLGAINNGTGVRVELWLSSQVGASISWPSVVVNFSASCTFAVTVRPVHNCFGFQAGSVVSATGTSTLALVTTATPTSSNTVAVGAAGTVGTGAFSDAQSVPWTLAEDSNISFSGNVRLMTAHVPLDGSGMATNITVPVAISQAWAALSVLLVGPSIQLDDFTYMLDEAGVLLNNPSSSLPIYDVSQVQGIDQLDVAFQMDNIDGTDGSYVSAKFVSGKTIVIDGTLITAPPLDHSLIDALRSNYTPKKLSINNPFYFTPVRTTVPRPLFFKRPNQNPRYLLASPVGVKVDETRDRTLSQIPYEVQAVVGDPRAYAPAVLAYSGATSSNIATLVVTNNGNTETYPRIYFSVYAAEAGVNSVFRFWNYTWPGVNNGNAGEVDVSALTLGTGFYCLDLAERTLTAYKLLNNPSDFSSAITQRFWFGLVPGPNRLSFQRVVGAASTEGFFVSKNDAWL